MINPFTLGIICGTLLALSGLSSLIVSYMQHDDRERITGRKISVTASERRQRRYALIIAVTGFVINAVSITLVLMA